MKKLDKRTLADHFTTSGVFSIPCKLTRDGFIPLTDEELKVINKQGEQYEVQRYRF